MANTKISGLTALATPAGEDLLAIVDDPSGTPTSKKVTVETLLSAYTVSSANTAVLKATGYSLTGSDATGAIDIAGTWNTTGTPTAIKLNVTDTASNAASLLMDLQVGGTSLLRINKSGTISGPVGSASDPALEFGNGTGRGFYEAANYQVFLANGGSPTILLENATPSVVRIQSAGSFQFSSGANVSSNAPDVFLYRDAANTLALRNSTNAQAFNIYNTYTDASNYERLNIAWDGANNMIIQTIAAGTGTVRNLYIGGGTGADTFIRSGGANRWRVLAGGNLYAGTDATYDIGQVSGNRPRTIFVSDNIVTGATDFMHETSAALADGAGAGAGTLSNAPSAGNPTKWIAINDNGTTRYIPTWT